MDSLLGILVIFIVCALNDHVTFDLPTQNGVRYASAWLCGRVPDLQSGGCGFESQLGLLRTKVYSAFHPSGSVNEYQLRLGRQRQVWLIPIADERVGVHCAGKTVKSLENMCMSAFCGGDSLRRGAISSVCTFTFTFRYNGNMSIQNERSERVGQTTTI